MSVIRRGMLVEVIKTHREGRSGFVADLHPDPSVENVVLVQFPNGARHWHYVDDLRESDEAPHGLS